MKDRNLPVDNNWRTPQWFYDELNKEFKFDHDPCPYNPLPINEATDGLNYDNAWGKVNFVNPPYSKDLKERFIKRGVVEKAMGNTSVFLIPVSTSTKIFHELIQPIADEIRFVKGRIKYQKLDPETGEWVTPKNGGMHDSMVVIFKGQ